MATSPSPASFFVRLDPRLGEGLQQQIYGSIRRAILDGVSPRGRGSRRRAPWPTTSASPARPRCWPCSSSRPRDTSPRGGAPARSWPPSCRTISCSGAAPARPPDRSIPPCRAAARRWRRSRRAPAASTARPGPFASARPAWTCSRSASGRGSPAAACARSRRPSSTTAIRRAFARCARPSPSHVQTARGTRCEADQVVIVAGAQQGFELVCRLLLDPGDRVWMEEPGYPGARSALRAAGARIVPGARGRRGAGRRAWAPGAPVTPASPT